MKLTEQRLKEIIAEEMHELGMNLDYGKGEGRMTRSQLFHIAEYAAELHEMIQDEDDLPEWCQSKIAVAADYLSKIKHYLEYKIVRIQKGDHEE